MSFVQRAPGVQTLDAPQRFYGLEIGARMSVLSLDGGLLLHSPTALAPELLSTLGEVRWVLAPNLFHHLYVGPWLDVGFEGWAGPGIAQKREDLNFEGTLEGDVHHPDAHPFGAELGVAALTCFSMTKEVVVLHRPSRSLIVSDLVFNLSAAAPWLSRAAMWSMGGYPGCRTTWLERFGMQRELAREELSTLLTWDFDRLIMAHGEVIDENAKAALERAFAWLW